MATTRRDARLLRSTRGRILTLLRERLQTVDELAQALGLTGNAIRAHLTTLERDGLIEPRDIRRGPSKPSHVYGLTPEAEQQLSRAYVPVLSALLAALVEFEDVETIDAMMQKAGQRLARQMGRYEPGGQAVAERLKPVLEIITELGGSAETEIDGNAFQVRGNSCPLAGITSHYEIACKAIAGLMSEVVGVPVAVRCEMGEHPHCCFAGNFEGPEPVTHSDG